MAFAPFDGVLLDDPRDAVPGAVAIQLHHQVEWALATRDRRKPLEPRALKDRAAACQALLGQGLLPDQLKALERHGLALGRPRDLRSLASLVRHLEAYLEAVERKGFLEPSAALWRAAGERMQGGRGFWVERQAEDGPLDAGTRQLAPPWLRTLCALRELPVRFRLATRRGAGRGGLFEGKEPHLVRQLLPTLESLTGLDHLELDAPEGWGENPWGAALDRLFEGPLGLDDGGRAALQRALLPTEASVWRSAVEQVCAWVEEGFAPAEITLVNPDPAGAGPILAAWLSAEGIPLRGSPGPALKQAPAWGPLWALLVGLRDLDPSALAAGLGASSAGTPLARSLRALAARLGRVDQTGEAALHQAFEALPEGDRAWVKDRWAFLWSLRGKAQPPSGWFQDLESLALRLELAGDRAAFYPALRLLGEAWEGSAEPLSFEALVQALDNALDVMRAPTEGVDRQGVQLLAPEALESSWEGSRATLLMDLGEGAWPPLPVANPELDWTRLLALNRALRTQAAAGEGEPDFPPHLQTFPLPQTEEGELLPRAFHRDAYRFNRVLALTRDRLVALSAKRDGAGQVRAQGPFWQALEGAGPWAPDPARSASDLRGRWEAAPAGPLSLARQEALHGTAPARSAPEADWMPGVWKKGTTAENPLSPTLLEGLARCPFRVHGERHLRLPSWEEGDALALHLGTLAHHLMEELLRGFVGAPHWPAAFQEHHGATSFSALQDLLQAVWRDHTEDWIGKLEPLSAAETERLRLGLETFLPALAALLAADLREGGPTKQELEFLQLPAEGEWRRELLGLELRLEPRPLPGGSPAWIQGTLDRLERLVSGDRAFLRIVDYKSSARARLQAYAGEEGAFGAHLQLPLYQALVEEEHGLPATALLLSLREGWKPVPMMLKGDDRRRLLANVAALLDRAQRGDFPPTPGEHCATCRLSALCGRPVDIDRPDTPGDEDEEDA